MILNILSVLTGALLIYFSNSSAFASEDVDSSHYYSRVDELLSGRGFRSEDEAKTFYGGYIVDCYENRQRVQVDPITEFIPEAFAYFGKPTLPGDIENRNFWGISSLLPTVGRSIVSFYNRKPKEIKFDGLRDFFDKVHFHGLNDFDSDSFEEMTGIRIIHKDDWNFRTTRSILRSGPSDIRRFHYEHQAAFEVEEENGNVFSSINIIAINDDSEIVFATFYWALHKSPSSQGPAEPVIDYNSGIVCKAIKKIF